jgi:hypothetical protein
MISTEVQRTLVKSPPELWAELSDPASLARHLGELGEIRITRTEPEKTVEWEAERTSGTVQIKPSGWGTRVTLTVTREVPASDAAIAPDAAIGSDAAIASLAVQRPAAHADPASSSAGDTVEPDDQDGATGPPSTAEAPPSAQAGPAPEGSDLTTPAVAEPTTYLARDPILQWRPQTAAGAALTHAWRSRERRIEQADDGEPARPAAQPLMPATGAPVASDADLGSDAPTSDEPIEVEAEPFEPELAPPDRFSWLAYEAEEPEPRRGFLTRLFGRRRKQAADPEPAEGFASIDTTDGDAEEIAAEQPQADAPGAMEAAVAGDAPDEMLEPQAHGGPDQAETPGTAETPGADASGTIEHAAGAEPAPSEIAPPGTPEAIAPAAATGPSPEPHPSEAASSSAPHEPGADLSAELKAAEETTTAEVTAVLTAVLDRLGAAHHRPFSRG